MYLEVKAYFRIALGDFSSKYRASTFSKYSGEMTNNYSANRSILYKFIGLYADFSGAKYYLFRLLCTNLLSHSLSLNFYSKILNWVNRFVQAQFLTNIPQSYSVAHWQSVCFSPRSSPVQILRPENSGRRKEILECVL